MESVSESGGTRAQGPILTDSLTSVWSFHKVALNSEELSLQNSRPEFIHVIMVS